LTRITSRVDLAMSACPSVRMNAEISETLSACPYERRDLGNYSSYNTGIRNADFWDSCAAQVCFKECHAHSNAHKPPKAV